MITELDLLNNKWVEKEPGIWSKLGVSFKYGADYWVLQFRYGSLEQDYFSFYLPVEDQYSIEKLHGTIKECVEYIFTTMRCIYKLEVKYKRTLKNWIL